MSEIELGKILVQIATSRVQLTLGLEKEPERQSELTLVIALKTTINVDGQSILYGSSER